MFDKHLFLVHLHVIGTYFCTFLACLRISQPHSFSLTANSTTTMSSMQCPIDQEWAQSLIGILPQVPQSWWPGYSSSLLYAGAVREIDFSDERGGYFLFEDDDDDDVGSHYPMQYNAVLQYSYREQRECARFRLPPNPPANLANEAFRVLRHNAQQSRQQRRQRLFPTNNNPLL